MSDTGSNEVSRQFAELTAQLAEDGYDGDTDVGKLVRRLSKALKEDGFLLTEAVPPKTKSAEVSAKLAKPAKVEPSNAAPAPEDDDTFVRAFRARNGFDTKVVEQLFEAIGGWRLKTVEHKGSHFVIATNAPRLTEKRVKTAIHRYVAELKSATPS